MKKTPGFRAPSVPGSTPAPPVKPVFDPSEAEAFINAAQVKAGTAKPKKASSARVSSTDERQVAADMTKQFVVRMTEAEHEALLKRFKASDYRYLHHYVKALIFPS